VEGSVTKLSFVMKRTAIVLFGMLVVLVAALATLGWYSDWSVRADHREQLRDLPGDELIPNPVASVTHAVTIQSSAHRVWPWLAQMGAARGGWYAYDFIDNGGHPSADRILPQFQNIGVGTVFPALPGAKDVFVVALCEPDRSLVLSWRSPGGTYLTTWAFVLEQPEANRTRLIVRGRAAPSYSPYGLPLWFAKLTAPWAHAIMEHKQLRGIQRRAEAAS
jgi:hypothetical protein